MKQCYLLKLYHWCWTSCRLSWLWHQYLQHWITRKRRKRLNPPIKLWSKTNFQKQFFLILHMTILSLKERLMIMKNIMASSLFMVFANPWMSNITINWEIVRSETSQAPVDLLNWNLHFNTISKWFACTLQFAKYCPDDMYNLKIMINVT